MFHGVFLKGLSSVELYREVGEMTNATGKAECLSRMSTISCLTEYLYRPPAFLQTAEVAAQQKEEVMLT